MKGFTKRVSQMISKLPTEQVVQLVDSLSAENESLYSILESLNTGLIICDENWKLMQVNKAAERYIPLKIRGSDYRYGENADFVWKIIDDDDVAEFLRTCSERQKCNISEEFTVSTASGSSKIINVSIQLLVQKKEYAGIIIKIDDITEKRNQEVLLRRMESLASLTNLAASVAHEIKNPLGSISIHIQLIQKALLKARKTDGLLPDMGFMDKHISVVNEEIERLNQIIVDFLFAVRPVSASLEPVDVNERIKAFISFAQPELDKKNIRLEVHLAEKAPKILLDPKLFKQALINLVQNAIAAMTEGGDLLISTKMAGERFVIAIADTGCGMDSETVSRVFEPYFTTKAKGTGLGLTMVYKIIKEFSGDIDVKSFPGEGTVFTISLPVPQKEKLLLE
ncbi:MAG: PAS domain S-box protein [Treponemataceae bacterium]|nr:PAS domain S-box protein [Treponemataceae bacterium]